MASTSTNNSKTTSSSSHLSFPTKEVTPETEYDPSGEADSEKRLWVGNLDPKLTEFQLLKLVKKYGPIHHFDFLFHRSGPNLGLPRGYAFVEYEDEESASKCMASLDGKQLLERRVVVRWAHLAVKEYPDEQAKLISRLPALGSSESPAAPPICKDRAINAIEAKLRAMDREKDQNFNMGQGSNRPGSSASMRYQYPNSEIANAFKPTTNPSYRPQHNNYRQHQRRPYDRNRKPYSR